MGWDFKSLDEEEGSEMGTKDDAFGPGRGEAGVVIGMEVGEEVCGGEGGGVVAEGVD